MNRWRGGVLPLVLIALATAASALLAFPPQGPQGGGTPRPPAPSLARPFP